MIGTGLGVALASSLRQQRRHQHRHPGAEPDRFPGPRRRCSAWPPPAGRRAAPPSSTCWRRSRPSDDCGPSASQLIGAESPAMKAKLCAGCGLPACSRAPARCGWRRTSHPAGRPSPAPCSTLLVGVSLLGCGLASWRARPENRLGPVMVFTGFAWFAGQLSEASAPWLYTIGLAVQSRVGRRPGLPAAVVPVRAVARPTRPLADGRAVGGAVRPAAAGDAVRQQGGAALPGLPEQPAAGLPRQSQGAGLAEPPAPARRRR